MQCKNAIVQGMCKREPFERSMPTNEVTCECETTTMRPARLSQPWGPLLFPAASSSQTASAYSGEMLGCKCEVNR